MESAEILTKAYDGELKSIGTTRQDQYTEMVNFYAVDHINSIKPVISVGSNVGAKTITVVDATGVQEE